MDEIVKSFKFSLTGKQISKKNMKQFKDIVALMKEYINDRFKDDNAMSTQVNSVIRKLDKLLIELKSQLMNFTRTSTRVEEHMIYLQS